MSSGIYLIDANSLITPAAKYYPFDFAKKFWDQLEDRIISEEVVILDKVKDEILKGDDDLKDWMLNISIKTLVNHKDPDVVAGYGEVLQHIQTSGFYKSSALTEWANNTVADPWIIATAKAKGITIVTQEMPSGGLSLKSPNKKAKIPDVANHFGIRVIDLFEMMRELSFKL